MENGNGSEATPIQLFCTRSASEIPMGSSCVKRPLAGSQYPVGNHSWRNAADARSLLIRWIIPAQLSNVQRSTVMDPSGTGTYPSRRSGTSHYQGSPNEERHRAGALPSAAFTSGDVAEINTGSAPVMILVESHAPSYYPQEFSRSSYLGVVKQGVKTLPVIMTPRSSYTVSWPGPVDAAGRPH